MKTALVFLVVISATLGSNHLAHAKDDKENKNEFKASSALTWPSAGNKPEPDDLYVRNYFLNT